MKLSQELETRGLIDRLTHDELKEKLDQGGLTFYAGFDPTADSLHVGQLALFNLMSLLQAQGHQPIGLAGGATGMIGDPGGKSAERNLLGPEQITHNIKGITAQIERFLGQAEIVNNADWLGKFTYIDFLRDVGKHFSVNQMVARDAVKARLEGNGISYTEFSYMLLQSYDFYELHRTKGVTLQIGGSDQWGNIVSGIDLTRRLGGGQLYGMTMPLITKSDGSKFGKSEAGTVWLSPAKTKPYHFYQFFLNTADEDVIRFLKVFTQVELAEIAALEASLAAEPHLRKAQKALAEAVTRRVHGEEQLQRVQAASRIFFGEVVENLDDTLLESAFAELPNFNLYHAMEERVHWDADLSVPEVFLEYHELLLVDVLVWAQVCSSKSDAMRTIQGGGIYVNNRQVIDKEKRLDKGDLASQSYAILRKGKKNYSLLKIRKD